MTAILIKHQRFWFWNVTRRYWKRSGRLTMLLSFVVAEGTLVFLLKESTITQGWAAAFFGTAITSMVLAPFAKYMLEFEDKYFSNQVHSEPDGLLVSFGWRYRCGC